MPTKSGLENHPLTVWLAMHAIDHHDFADELGVTVQTLWRWRAGGSKPVRAMRRRIEKLTNGSVPVTTWYEAGDAS